MNVQMPVRGSNAVPAVLLIAAFAGAAVVLVSGIGITGNGAKPTSKINGTFTVTQPAGFEAAGACSTDAAKDGTVVVVSDAAGKALGAGRLFDGTGTKVKGDEGGKASQCRFGFTVLRLPALESYQVRVGTGEPHTVSRADLISNHWRLDLA
jgi:hypothetical protein